MCLFFSHVLRSPIQLSEPPTVPSQSVPAFAPQGQRWSKPARSALASGKYGAGGYGPVRLLLSTQRAHPQLQQHSHAATLAVATSTCKRGRKADASSLKASKPTYR